MPWSASISGCRCLGERQSLACIEDEVARYRVTTRNQRVRWNGVEMPLSIFNRLPARITIAM
jgi:hypothetical protein